MNALKVKRALERKRQEQAITQSVRKRVNEFPDERAAVEIANSKNNAMLHVFWTFILLNEEFNFGKKRLSRILAKMHENNDHFRMLLEGGVAWTWVFKQLDRIGLDYGMSADERKHLEHIGQKMYEKGVKHAGEGVINVYAENEKHYLKSDK